jgi:type IV pilus assembly protein PilB
MPTITNDIEAKLLKLLIEEGLIDEERESEVYHNAKANNLDLFDELKAKEIIDEQTLAHAVASVFGVPFLFIDDTVISQDILSQIPLETVEKMQAVPVAEKDSRLCVAMLDATNVQGIDYLSSMAQKPIKAYMASPAGIKSAISQYRADFTGVDEAIKADTAEANKKKDIAEAQTIVQDSPISKALVSILEYAVKSRASDVHIEPLENDLLIRCRIDGVLQEVMTLPKSIDVSLVTRIKILSNLKIDEHRLPQDGRFTVHISDKDVDLRIAISPVIWGEQVVIRLLEKNSDTLDFNKLGVVGRAYRSLERGIERPNGMILTSGPTGSGKTTTLYALIKMIKKESINIVTLEDPVEYKIEGVNQIQINPEAGLTFANGLRSVLRQDPDVIMVGEIRDAETASLAVQAALTGHLVFSTLHTNSAAGILPRLLDMGVEPFLLASTLNTVIGQRLVRKIAEKREKYQSSAIETDLVKNMVGWLLPRSNDDVAKVGNDLGYQDLPLYNQPSYTFTRGIDDEEAPKGYLGRTGLFEAIDVDDDIQKLIVARATANEVRKIALAKGMVSMRQDGILKVLSGITTIDEVNRVTSDIA